MTSTTRSHTPFGLESTAAEVIDGIDLSGRNAIVTGAASGIGVETARALASAGWDYHDRVTCCDVGWLSHRLIWPHFASVVVGLDVA